MLKVYRIFLEPNLPILQSVNAFLIEGERPILIDSGYQESVGQFSAQLDEMGFKLRDISMIINTHEHLDHFGGNAVIKEVSEAKIAAHERAIPLIEDMRKQLPPEKFLKKFPDVIAEYARMRSSIYENLKTAKVDVRLKEGDSLKVDGLSLEVLHTPGHAPGHICLYERESRSLFAGDMITGKGSPFVDCLRGNMGEFLKSLERLKTLEINRAFLSHDGETTEVKERIDKILQRELAVEQKLLEVLKNGRKDLSELVEEVYGGRGFPYFTYNSALAHLLKLQSENLVKVEKKAGKLVVTLR
jgi:glyoxylase-like metal-dependent hydrolase (beta-lactamase superfamily II)